MYDFNLACALPFALYPTYGFIVKDILLGLFRLVAEMTNKTDRQRAEEIVVKKMGKYSVQPAYDACIWKEWVDLIESALRQKGEEVEKLFDPFKKLPNLNHAHHIDIKVRMDGTNRWYEGDWLKNLQEYLRTKAKESSQ